MTQLVLIIWIRCEMYSRWVGAQDRESHEEQARMHHKESNIWADVWRKYWVFSDGGIKLHVMWIVESLWLWDFQAPPPKSVGSSQRSVLCSSVRTSKQWLIRHCVSLRQSLLLSPATGKPSINVCTLAFFKLLKEEYPLESSSEIASVLSSSDTSVQLTRSGYFVIST